MTMTEKAAYLKGLRDGLSLSTETSEGKLLDALINLVSDMAERVDDLEETTLAISDELDGIEEDLDDMEEEIDAIEACIDEEFTFGYDDDEDEEDDAFDEDEDGEVVYELECPSCNGSITVSGEELEAGFACPHCDAQLDFDLSEEDE